MLTVGAQFPLEPLEDEARLRDLAAAQERGNHGGATNKPTALDTFFRDEVKKGWMLPLPLSKLDQIPNLCLGPVNIVEQGTIDMHGNRVKSEQLTHDLSFDFGLGKPVNARAIEEQLTPCFYGHALRRFCHYIVATPQHSDLPCKVRLEIGLSSPTFPQYNSTPVHHDATPDSLHGPSSHLRWLACSQHVE